MAKSYLTTSSRTVYTSERIRIDCDGPRDYSLYLDDGYAGSYQSCAKAEYEGALWLAQKAGVIPPDPEPLVTVTRRTLQGGIPGEEDIFEIANRWREAVLSLDVRDSDPDVFSGALIAFGDVLIDGLNLRDLRMLRAILAHPTLGAYLDK